MISKRTETSRVNTAQNQPHRRPPRAAAVTAAAALLTLAGLALRRPAAATSPAPARLPGRQPLLPGPAEATLTVIAADQGSGAASTVSRGIRCGVTGQPFTVLILASPGRPAEAPTSPSALR